MACHSGLGAGYSSYPRMTEEPRFRRISDNLLWKYRLWITYDADLEEYLVTEPWPVLDDIEYMVSRYAKFSIRFDPRRGMPHSLLCNFDVLQRSVGVRKRPPGFGFQMVSTAQR